MATKRPVPRTAFKPGQSGNPRGKPAGTLSRSTRLLAQLMEGNAETITKVVIDAAQAGDLTAARIILDRVLPPARERPIQLDLPPCTDATGVALAQDAILQAVGRGDLLPKEAQTLSAIVDGKRRSLETQDLADRITKLEQIKNGNA